MFERFADLLYELDDWLREMFSRLWSFLKSTPSRAGRAKARMEESWSAEAARSAELLEIIRSGLIGRLVTVMVAVLLELIVLVNATYQVNWTTLWLNPWEMLLAALVIFLGVLALDLGRPWKSALGRAVGWIGFALLVRLLFLSFNTNWWRFPHGGLPASQSESVTILVAGAVLVLYFLWPQVSRWLAATGPWLAEKRVNWFVPVLRPVFRLLDLFRRHYVVGIMVLGIVALTFLLNGQGNWFVFLLVLVFAVYGLGYMQPELRPTGETKKHGEHSEHPATVYGADSPPVDPVAADPALFDTGIDEIDFDDPGDDYPEE